MTRFFFQLCVQKNTHRQKGCDWLTSRKYYGITSTRKVRLIVNGFNTPTNNDGDKDNDILAIAYLASDTRDTGEGAGGGGGSGDRHCRPPWALAMEPLRPPLPAMVPRMPSASLACCHHPCPPCRQNPLPVFLNFAPLKNRHARVHPAGHLCCGHTSSANHGSNSALALLSSAPACHHCSHCPPGRRGAWAMPPPW